MRKTCPKCAYLNDCGYWKLDGKKDKGGNTIHLNPDLIHNCQDFKPKS
mgnify:FL=1